MIDPCYLERALQENTKAMDSITIAESNVFMTGGIDDAVQDLEKARKILKKWQRKWRKELAQQSDGVAA